MNRVQKKKTNPQRNVVGRPAETKPPLVVRAPKRPPLTIGPRRPLQKTKYHLLTFSHTNANDFMRLDNTTTKKGGGPPRRAKSSEKRGT